MQMQSTLYPSATRGHANHGWLDTHHSFSFASFYDPKRMGFGSLRVLNDDRVAPGRGFGAHPHRDMEIITFVLEGALEHRDSSGHRSIIRPGDVQYMSAGRGVYHSEMNASRSEPVRFLQVWVVPDVLGAAPRYAQERFNHRDAPGTFVLVASKDGRDGSIEVRQDLSLYRAVISPGHTATLSVEPDRSIWVHAVDGQGSVADHNLSGGDGLALRALRSLDVSASATEEIEVLVFDMGPKK